MRAPPLRQLYFLLQLTGATSLGAVDVTAAPPDQQLDSPQPIASELGVATQVIGDIQGEI